MKAAAAATAAVVRLSISAMIHISLSSPKGMGSEINEFIVCHKRELLNCAQKCDTMIFHFSKKKNKENKIK